MGMGTGKIKICGITSLEDALQAIAAGADSLGFNFYPPSPRYLTPEAAAEITRQLPPFITKVALFVDETPANIETVLAQAYIDCIQFHGNETNEFCSQFHKPFIKALRVRSKEFLDDQMAQFPNACALLVDAYVKGVPGGTGQSFDWSLIPHNPVKPIILAGGLEADNVAEAIRTTQPYSVDVSGGVEASKGIKDHHKVNQFIAQARMAYGQLAANQAQA